MTRHRGKALAAVGLAVVTALGTGWLGHQRMNADPFTWVEPKQPIEMAGSQFTLTNFGTIAPTAQQSRSLPIGSVLVAAQFDQLVKVVPERQLDMECQLILVRGDDEWASSTIGGAMGYSDSCSSDLDGLALAAGAQHQVTPIWVVPPDVLEGDELQIVVRFLSYPRQSFGVRIPL